jgi:hypothetical protein
MMIHWQGWLDNNSFIDDSYQGIHNSVDAPQCYAPLFNFILIHLKIFIDKEIINKHGKHQQP